MTLATRIRLTAYAQLAALVVLVGLLIALVAFAIGDTSSVLACDPPAYAHPDFNVCVEDL